MQPWQPDISGVDGPKYLAIAEAISRDIEHGSLRPGDRLPPQRALAEALAIDLTTVTRAYGEAQRLGLIEGSGRRGSFVLPSRVAKPNPSYSDPGDIGMNAPPEGSGATLGSELRKTVDALLTPGAGAFSLQYQPAGGIPEVRGVGADLLARRGIPCHEDTVLVAAGGQHALHAIFSTELSAGDVLAVGQFAYPGLLSLARRFGIELRAITSDSEGMRPDALDAVCGMATVRGIYLVPANDNPTTSTMSGARREAIAEVARRRGLLIIEDDAYGLLPASPLPPLAAFSPERTWHIASVSKILSPGLRVAWLRAPDVATAWRLAADMHETAIMAPPLNTAVVADWVRSGTFDRLVGEVREEAKARQAIARDCLRDGTFHSQAEGFHLWVPLGAEANPGHIADAVRPHGLSVIWGDAFAVDPINAPPALRISIGGALSHDRLKRGLSLLEALINPEASGKVSLV
jgi:DNA-binding transcriptional MocR family regulator